MHPIVALQASLLGALNADTALVALVGDNGVFDGVPKGRAAPYGVITRHDVLARDGDLAPGHEHRLTLQFWHTEASRKAVLAMAERAVTVVLGADLDGGGLLVTFGGHLRTDTAVDDKTGKARAAVLLRFFSEPG